MAKYGRKKTGGRYKKFKKRKLYEKKGAPREIILGKEKKKQIKIRGGHIKNVLLNVDTANVYDKKTKKAKKVKILNVIEVPSNPFLARKNVILKGAIIETELGKARVTNRPSQESTVQAVLLD